MWNANNYLAVGMAPFLMSSLLSAQVFRNEDRRRRRALDLLAAIAKGDGDQDGPAVIGQRFHGSVVEIASRLAGEAKGSYGGTQIDTLCAEHNWLQWRVDAGWEKTRANASAEEIDYDQSVRSLARHALQLSESVVDASRFRDTVPDLHRVAYKEVFEAFDHAMRENVVVASRLPKEAIEGLLAQIDSVIKSTVGDPTPKLDMMVSYAGFEGCRSYAEFLRTAFSGEATRRWLDGSLQTYGPGPVCFVMGTVSLKKGLGLILALTEKWGYGQPTELLHKDMSEHLLSTIREAASGPDLGLALEEIKILRRAVIGQNINLDDKQKFAIGAAELCMGKSPPYQESMMHELVQTEMFKHRVTESDVRSIFDELFGYARAETDKVLTDDGARSTSET